jgi:hypothetical protein
MRRIILPSVACLAVTYLFTLSHKRQEFREKFTEHKMCVLIFCRTFLWNTSRSRKNSARHYHKVRRSSHRVRVTLVKFETNFNFLDRFSKNTHIPNFMKSSPPLPRGSRVVACRRTDRHHEANSCFSQFREGAQKSRSLFQNNRSTLAISCENERSQEKSVRMSRTSRYEVGVEQIRRGM